jgi:CRP-like cAMP-binding protein
MLVDVNALRAHLQSVDFPAGQRLRQKGQHYNDMYLLTGGMVEVDFEDGRRAGRVVITGPGQPIGEIGFLRGLPATATVTACRPTSALVVDDAAQARLETRQPELAAALSRHLAETAEERTSQNLVFTSGQSAVTSGAAIEVLMCRNDEMLRSAQELRYAVYCEELGRKSPFADHQRKIITDELDRFGHTLIAIEAGQVIGTIRASLAWEGPLGSLEQTYGMTASTHHPSATSICTKLIVRKSKRGSPAAMKLIAAMVRFGLRHGVKECYIDCVPTLLHYYRALGFTVAGPKFFHRENGPSYPMALDLIKHGEALSNDQGPRDYLKLFVKAQAIRLFAAMRGRRRAATL